MVPGGLAVTPSLALRVGMNGPCSHTNPMRQRGSEKRDPTQMVPGGLAVTPSLARQVRMNGARRFGLSSAPVQNSRFIPARKCDMSNDRPHEPPMPEPLAFFITWSTYG